MNNVRDFGAVGDGIHKDTAAIQNAINQGGEIWFPPGIYLSGTLYLVDCCALHLEPGAILRASPDPADYNADDFCPENQSSILDKASGAHLLIGYKIHSVTISGGGVIDGNARVWMGEIDPLYQKYPGYKLPEWRPSQMLFFCGCREVTLENITLTDAPYWTCLFLGCDHVLAGRVRIENDYKGHNTDGFDIDCSRNVIIRDCIISGSDDCIAVRACAFRLAEPSPCEYIQVSDCILETNQAGIRVGVGDGLIRRCRFSNLAIRRASVGIAVCPRWYRGRGADIEDIVFEKIFMDVERPFNITSRVIPCQEEAGQINYIRSIQFQDISGYCNRSGMVTAHDQCVIDKISFDRTNLVYGHNDDREWEIWYDGNFSVPSAFYLQNSTNISFGAMKLYRMDAAHEKFPVALRHDNCSNLHGEENLIFQ